ncbi:hypothetical protein [Halegenticoccus soli]|uniref:hypothetical protein n=1 Tax=Halegenticoccus soli TaxID=1985678 RepID=UPI000C6DBC49|nr:hypothetical protein [Halegenticoccus soli]
MGGTEIALRLDARTHDQIRARLSEDETIEEWIHWVIDRGLTADEATEGTDDGGDGWYDEGFVEFVDDCAI